MNSIILFFLSIATITMLAFAFGGCSSGDDNSNGTPPNTNSKSIIGKLGSSYSFASPSRKRTAPSTSLLIDANEVWVCPITKTDYYSGASNVTFNYSAIFENKHVYQIADDGSFSLDITNPCLSPSGCVGTALLLVDSTENETKNQIKGMLTLDGNNTLAVIPYAQMDTSLDMGVLHQGDGSRADEAIGDSIDAVSSSFSIESSELTLLARTDDHLKMVKNLYIP